jgi:DNA-directed RNA polymerase subunit beta'
MNRQTDELTGLSNIVVIDAKQRSSLAGRDMRPMVKLVSDDGKEIFLSGTNVPAQYYLPVDAIINFENGNMVGRGGCYRSYPSRAFKNA